MRYSTKGTFSAITMLLSKIVSVLLLVAAVRTQVLVNHQEYFVQVLQEAIWDLEEKDWCNFRVPPIHANGTVIFHGWTVAYAVDYTNGFLVSFSHLNTRQTVSPSLDDERFSITGHLQFHDVVTGYDAAARTSDDEHEHHYTGLFTHLILDFAITIQKELATGDITASGSLFNQQGDGRMQFLPSDPLSEVLSRFFFPGDPNIAEWLANNIIPAVEDIAKHRVEFPKVCYRNVC